MSINSLDAGDVNNDGFVDLVVTNNNQIVSIDKIHLYTFSGEIPDSSQPAWTSASYNHLSGIILYDVNRDNKLDLIYGGWWEPIYIQPGNGNDFDNMVYTSTTKPVTEAFQVINLGREEMETKTDTIIITRDNIAMVYLSKQIVENLIQVNKNGLPVEYENYCAVPNKNWISFTDRLFFGDIIIIEFEYSDYGDLIVSNWENNNGDYIFYNNYSSGVSVNHITFDKSFSLYPNPAKDQLRILFKEDYCVITPPPSIYNSLFTVTISTTFFSSLLT